MPCTQACIVHVALCGGVINDESILCMNPTYPWAWQVKCSEYTDVGAKFTVQLCSFPTTPSKKYSIERQKYYAV